MTILRRVWRNLTRFTYEKFVFRSSRGVVLFCLLISFFSFVPCVRATETLNILLLGQSNMKGTLGSNITVPMSTDLRNGRGSRLARTWLTWYGKPGDSNQTHLHIVRPSSYSMGLWGPEVFGGWTLANPDYDVVMTKASFDGVTLNAFMPGNSGWNQIVDNYAITQAEAALEGLAPIGEVDVLWWGQGEAGITPPGNYYNELTTLIEDLKVQFSSPNMKVVFMGLGRGSSATAEADIAFKDYVAAHPATTLYVSGQELDLRMDHVVEFPSESSAGPHYSAIGMQRLGVRMASATLALVAPEDDIDGDGLTAALEFQAGTDPSKANTDGDQFDDGIEYHAGGDPLHDDTQTFSAILSSAASYDLYSSSQVQALHVDAPLLAKDPVTGKFRMTIKVQKSTDLSTFRPLPFSLEQTIINPAGELEFGFTSPENATFFRLDVE